MRIRSVISLLMLLSVVLGCLAPATLSACSMVFHFRGIASNYHRVRETPLIVLARPVSTWEVTELDPNRAPYSPTQTRVSFEVGRVLKGSYKKKTLTLAAWIVAGQPERTPEDDFLVARHFYFSANCEQNRGFSLNQWYVLFLERDRTPRSAGSGGRLHWRLAEERRGRVEELVDGPHSPWVLAVEHYAKIAALNARKSELEALVALQQQVIVDPNKASLRALVPDINVALCDARSGLTTEEVIALYRGMNGSAERIQALNELANRQDLIALPVMREVLETGGPFEQWYPAVEFARRTRVRDLLPLLMTRLVGLSREEQYPVLHAILVTAIDRDRTLVHSLIEPYYEYYYNWFALWFERHPSPDAVPGLTRFMPSPGESLSRVADHAASGEPTSVLWALAHLEDPDTDTRQVAFQVLARSPLPQAVERACELIRAGGPFLEASLRLYDFAQYRHWDRIACIEQLPGLSDAQRLKIHAWRKEEVELKKFYSP